METGVYAEIYYTTVSLTHGSTGAGSRRIWLHELARWMDERRENGDIVMVTRIYHL